MAGSWPGMKVLKKRLGVGVRRIPDMFHSLIPNHGMRSSSVMLVTDR